MRDARAAARTNLFFAARIVIDDEFFLHLARLAERIAEAAVGERRAAEPNAFAQDELNALVQSRDLLCRERAGRALRMDACEVQRLVRVNVAESCDALLVEQQWLDRRAASAHDVREHRRRELTRERLRAQMAQHLVRVSRQRHAPKLAHVRKPQCLPIHHRHAPPPRHIRARPPPAERRPGTVVYGRPRLRAQWPQQVGGQPLVLVLLKRNHLALDEVPHALAQFERWLAAALTSELPEPNAMTLATATRDGQPSARMVLFKGLLDMDDQGYLATYGVVLVPPPPEQEGGWFVALAGWNDEAEAYLASTDGPIFESREEAMEEANKVLVWIAEKGERQDLIQIWEQMQKTRSEDVPWTKEPRTLGNWWQV